MVKTHSIAICVYIYIYVYVYIYMYIYVYVYNVYYMIYIIYINHESLLLQHEAREPQVGSQPKPERGTRRGGAWGALGAQWRGARR